MKKKLIPITIKDVDVNKIHDCPDYWDLDFTNGELNYGICNNTHNLGTCKDENGTTIKTMNFNTYLNTAWTSLQSSASSASSATGATTFTVLVPPNSPAGTMIQVLSPNGYTVKVAVPAGTTSTAAGQTFEVDIPTWGSDPTSTVASSTTTIPSAGEPSVNNNLFNLKEKCRWAKKCNVTWDIVDSLC